MFQTRVILSSVHIFQIWITYAYLYLHFTLLMSNRRLADISNLFSMLYLVLSDIILPAFWIKGLSFLQKRKFDKTKKNVPFYRSVQCTFNTFNLDSHKFDPHRSSYSQFHIKEVSHRSAVCNPTYIIMKAAPSVRFLAYDVARSQATILSMLSPTPEGLNALCINI